MVLRKLLCAFALCLAACPVEARRLHGTSYTPPPVTITGNVNLDLDSVTYFNGVWQFVDITKNGQGWRATSTSTVNGYAGGTQFVGNAYQGTNTAFWGTGTTYQPSAVGVFIDTNGDLLSTQPSGTLSFSNTIAVVENGGAIAYGMPPNYASTQLTITFNNNAGGYTVGLSADSTSCSSTTSPFTCTLPASASTVTLSVTGSGNNPPQQIVVQKTTSYNAGLIASGQYLDPVYASTTAQGAWSLRMMDWMGPVYNNQVSYNASTYGTVANGSWGQAAANNQWGMPLAVQVSAAKQMNKHLWTNLPQGSFSKIATIADIPNASPATVILTGPCPFSNGDTIYFSGGGSYGSNAPGAPYAGPLQANPTSFASSTFTGSGIAALANNTPIVFGYPQNSNTSDGQTYPTGITVGTQYWTVNATGVGTSSGTYQIASTPGGSALSLSGSAPATINVVVNSAHTLGGGAIGNYGQIVNPTYSGGTWTLNGHGIPNGTPVKLGVAIAAPLNLNNADGLTYPSGFTKLQQYYIVNATTNTFQLSASIGGSAITSGSMTGAGNMALYLTGAPFTVSNVSGNTFQLNGLSTAGFVGQAHPNGSNGISGGWNIGGEAPFVFKGYNLTDTLANVGSIASYLQTNLSSPLLSIFEPENEIWNAAYNTNDEISVLSNYQSQLSGGYWFALGYIQAAQAYAAYTTYGGANRANYKFVLSGNWTGNDCLGGTNCPGGNTGTNNIIAGANQFLTDNSLSMTLGPVGSSTNYLFDYVSMTTYTGNSYNANSDTPSTATFGTNTIAFPSGLQKIGGGAVTDETIAGITDANIGLPIKLNTNSPGGTLPTGLTAGTLGGSSYPSGSGTIYWVCGTGPNYSLCNLPAAAGGTPVSFSGGSGSNTATIASSDVIQYLMTQSTSLHSSDPTDYPNQWTYYSNEIGNDTIDARWTGGNWFGGSPTAASVAWSVKVATFYNNNYLASGKPLAGVKLVGYEGGDNNPPYIGGGDTNFLLLNDATWQSAYQYEQYSSAQATVFLATHTQLVASGLMYKQAQFVESQAFSIQGNQGLYGARTFIGDTNPRWEGVVNTNSLN